jgi:hypothetical protein
MCLVPYLPSMLENKCLTKQHWCSFVEFSIGSSNMVTNCIDGVEKDVWTHMNKMNNYNKNQIRFLHFDIISSLIFHVDTSS